MFLFVYRFGGDKGIIFFGTCQVKERAQAVGEKMAHAVISGRIRNTEEGMHQSRHNVVMSGCMVIVPWSLSGFVINERHMNLCIGIITAVTPVIFFILIEFLTVVSGNDQDRIV